MAWMSCYKVLGCFASEPQRRLYLYLGRLSRLWHVKQIKYDCSRVLSSRYSNDSWTTVPCPSKRSEPSTKSSRSIKAAAKIKCIPENSKGGSQRRDDLQDWRDKRRRKGVKNQTFRRKGNASRKAQKRYKADSRRPVELDTSRRRLNKGFQDLANATAELLKEDSELRREVEGIDLVKAQKVLGYKFKDPALLRTVLIVGSSAEKRCNMAAWLGDSVLYFLITRELTNIKPGASVEELHKARLSYVSRQACALNVQKLKLGDFAILSRSIRGQPCCQDADGNPTLTLNLAGELFEALIGAIYLDGGLKAVIRLLIRTGSWPKHLPDIHIT